MAIYLDHAATTPLRPEVLEAMTPYLTEVYGNPSSVHSAGRRARAGLDEARERLATRLGGQPREIVFTSGGSEALNLALKGAAWAGKARGHRIITTAVEHHAVMHSLRHLEKFGFEVITLPVDRYGRVDPDDVESALSDRTVLVTVQLANNEVGTIQPVAEVGRRVREHRGVLFVVDAVQAAPYLDINVDSLGADFVAIAGHKFEGPKGSGAMWIRHGTHLLAQLHGGSQERYRRAGTENVAGAVGLAAAYDLACDERAATVRRLRRLRGRLSTPALAISGTELTGHPTDRLPSILSLIVRDVEGAAIVTALDLEGLACSTGSACTTGSTEVSHVLTAMGYPDEEARGSIRLSLGRTSSDEEVETAASMIPRVIDTLRLAATELAGEPAGQAVL